MEVSIRDAKESDVENLERLDAEFFSLPHTAEQFLRELKGPMHELLLAEDGSGTLLGYCGFSCVLDEGYVSNIAVVPQQRRRGIAQKLMEAAFLLCKERELAFLSLEVRRSNEPAKKLYEKMGFTFAGKIPNYYQAPKEDALVFTKYFKEGAGL